MALTKARLERFRRILEAMDGRVGRDLESLESQARSGVGGEAGGSLSNAPMHLADLGTEQYMQELNATLLENEEYIRTEIRGALGRLDRDAYGLCERCGESILLERLEVLPYTRYCTACSAAVGDGAAANLNEGRPESMGGLVRRHGAAGVDPSAAGDAEAGGDGDVHAAGTAGGGTAIGGLAGTTIGDGDPDDGNLEEATGSGDYDRDREDDDGGPTAYSGRRGGAVGGAVAGRRASGGRTGGGLAPGPSPGDAPTGS